MNRKRIWGWWFYDWASQPYATLLLTFVFAIYFAEVAMQHYVSAGLSPVAAGAAAQSLWGWTLAASGFLIALSAPVLGAIADSSGRRMPWIRTFSVFYIVGAAGLWLLMPDGSGMTIALICFVVGLIGMEFTAIFTNALMPTLTTREDMGRVSGSGYAFGYVAGVVALAIMLALFAENPETGHTILGNPPALGLDAAQREGTRFVGPFTAIWFAVFMIPFFLWVKEPRQQATQLRIRQGLSDLRKLIVSLRHRRSLAAWLLSSMFSRDALVALYSFGGFYAATVLGWPVIWSGIFGIVSAISAAIICWIGGRADSRWGPKPVIIGCTLVLAAVCLIVVGMSRAQIWGIPFAEGSRIPDAIFFACGAVIGGAGGMLQAASRTMMVRHTSAERATEAFGLYALSGKATAFLAPLLIAVVTTASGDQRLGISPLIVMFLLSLALLSWVKAEGEAGQ